MKDLSVNLAFLFVHNRYHEVILGIFLIEGNLSACPPYEQSCITFYKISVFTECTTFATGLEAE